MSYNRHSGGRTGHHASSRVHEKDGNISGHGFRNGSNSQPNRLENHRDSNGYDRSGRIPSKKLIHGTDRESGMNSRDEAHGLQTHSLDYTSRVCPTSEVDITKNYKVVYDPELDKSLSKADRKGKHRKLLFSSASAKKPADPRIAMGLPAYYGKPIKTSKKMPFKILPQARFTFDKDSLGAPPQSELVVWDLPSTISEIYLVNYFESFGNSVKDVKFINDPINAAPLGIATFTFQGSVEKASSLAKAFLKTVKAEEPKIDGVAVKAALNDLEGSVLKARMKISSEKLRSEFLRRENERKRLEEQRKLAEIKTLKIKEKEKEKEESTTSAETKAASLANTTTLSHKNGRKLVKGVFLPPELAKYVKERPFLYIDDRYLSTRKFSTSDVKKTLAKYNWTRVLLDNSGFFIVFNSYEECKKCFESEDGARFFDCRMFMNLCVPEHYQENTTKPRSIGESDIISEASDLLIKDFKNFLGKDIRERIIAPIILDLLSTDKYPELMKELKEKELSESLQAEKLKSERAENLSQSKQDSPSSSKYVFTLPSFAKIRSSSGSGMKRKKLLPMQRALDLEEDESDDSDGESSRSATPVPTLKRERAASDNVDVKRQKSSKLKDSLLYSDFSEDEAEPASSETPPAEDEMEIDIVKDDIENKYQATETSLPQLVYEENQPRAGSVLDISRLQDLIKDEEDMNLARKLLSGSEATPIKHPNYWAWRQKEQASSAIVSDEESIGLLSSHLECDTGSFKSEGYRKIADADKIEYLPHRKKIHKPLKTVQTENDESGSGAGNTSNNVQSSRVNRANNRRFAADISAQKQIISSESDILNLNALNKRKKPVSFARSAIHNWGLYALEPIAAKEMIIEYVGESIRQQVAEQREKSYLKTGIGSSYLFRIDENIVIDATKKGGIARFINHCCNPSCTAKIIKVDGKKRIVIYALKDIEANEELTYDYKFERETNDDERIRCLCGAPGCKGYLN